MGQNEVYQWLKTQRVELKNDSFFTARQIQTGMVTTTPITLSRVYDSLPRLSHGKLVEFQLGGNPWSSWHMSYRYKIPEAKTH